jgi:hypothetical protein
VYRKFLIIGVKKMKTKDRLAVEQSALTERGVRDVKFLFKRESLGVPMSDLADDVADVLKSYREGKKSVMEQLPSEELTLAA